MNPERSLEFDSERVHPPSPPPTQNQDKLTADHTIGVLTSKNPLYLLIGHVSITAALVHHRGISVRSYFDLCSIAWCLAVLRDPTNLCTLSPKVCKISPPLLQKLRKVHYYI